MGSLSENFMEFMSKNDFDSTKNKLMSNLWMHLVGGEVNKDLFDFILEQYNKANKEKHHSKEEVIPEHYTKLAIEPIKFIFDNKLDFCAGNIVKYVSRLGGKDSDKDELKKIFFYFDYLIHGNYDLTRRTFNG